MLPIYDKTRRYLLLEKVTVFAEHVEGGPPRWRLTNPIEQHAIGVQVFRQLRGAWIEALWQHREDKFTAHRVRMIDEAARWPGFPQYVELYDIVGDSSLDPSFFDTDALADALFKSIKNAEKNAGVK